MAECLAVGRVGTVVVGTTGFSVVVVSEDLLELPEAVGTLLPEGAPVTPVSASVTSALFTGTPEEQPLTRSFCFLTAASTTRDVTGLPVRLPPGVPLVREPSE